MRIIAYVPNLLANFDSITSMIDVHLPEKDFEIEYATSKDDLIQLSRTLYYDALLIMVDEREKSSVSALNNLDTQELKGPIVCMYQNSSEKTLFTILGCGAISATRYEDVIVKKEI